MKHSTILSLVVSVVLTSACVGEQPCHEHQSLGGGGSDSSDGGGGAGGSGPAECQTADDCTGPHWRCEMRRCVAGRCVQDYAPEGTPDLTDSFPGDCTQLVCDGHGRSKRVFAQDDFIDDGKPCTIEYCTEHGPLRNDAPDGSRCVGHLDGSPIVGFCEAGICTYDSAN